MPKLIFFGSGCFSSAGVTSSISILKFTFFDEGHQLPVFSFDLSHDILVVISVDGQESWHHDQRLDFIVVVPKYQSPYLL
jgi:hypothetical protein